MPGWPIGAVLPRPATTSSGGRAKQGKEALIGFVRSQLKSSLLEKGALPMHAAWADEALDPTVLTIGFARRFASDKRATLLLSQPDRLKALLLDPKRPVQLIFAGKAHPADDLGKEMIRQMVQFARGPVVRHRIAFIEDYDIAVARTLLQGCDVWLNNPRRPMQASGTSGQKAALNGALNLSVLDGWWDEMFDGKNGWQIASAEPYVDLQRRDEVEANSLFEILERQVVPLYYDRGGDRFPRQWVARIKDSEPLGPGSRRRGWCGTTPGKCTSPWPRGQTSSAPRATRGPRLWPHGRCACSRPGERWPCCPSTSTPRRW